MNKTLAALALVLLVGRPASAQIMRVMPVVAGNGIGAAASAVVPQSLSSFSGPALSAPALAPGLALSAPSIGAAAAPVPSMEDHQRELKALWAEERALSPEESARRHSEIYKKEQDLVQRIAIARGKREGATPVDLAQAKIAEMELKITAHLSTLISSLVESGMRSSDSVGLLSISEAAFEQLRAFKAGLPAGTSVNLRMRALEK